MSFLKLPMHKFGETFCCNGSIQEALSSTTGHKKFVWCCRQNVTINIVSTLTSNVYINGALVDTFTGNANKTYNLTPSPCGDTLEVIIPCLNQLLPSETTKPINDYANAITLTGSHVETFTGDYTCFNLKTKLQKDSIIDDFGIVGTILFKNNVSCSTGAGEVTKVNSDTIILPTIAQTPLETIATIDYDLESDSFCGAPTLINGNVLFSWEYKPFTLVVT